jgi:hypothetical protein
MRYLSDSDQCRDTTIRGVNCVSRFWQALLFRFLAVLLVETASLAQSQQSKVIEDALGNQFCRVNLRVIEAGCDNEIASTDTRESPSYRHFSDVDLLKSINYMEREKLKILNLSVNADKDQSCRALALYHMGLLFHTVQQFYSRSNYLELKLTELGKSSHAPTSDELYGLDLVDWSSLTTLLRNGGKCDITLKQAGKTELKAVDSAQSIAGIPYVSIIQELSRRETERQWRTLSTLIKARLQNNGAAVLVSLQKAGVADEIAAQVLQQKIEP